jgi:recombination protein RecR
MASIRKWAQNKNNLKLNSSNGKFGFIFLMFGEAFRHAILNIGGLISPLEGIGPEQIKIAELIGRVRNKNVTEIVFALPATVEGDTTGFYLFKQLQHININITTLSKGIANGDQLEYADEITLGRSIVDRIFYKDTIGVF